MGKKTLEFLLYPHQHLLRNCISEWDEVPSDDEEKVLQEDESKYVLSKFRGRESVLI